MNMFVQCCKALINVVCDVLPNLICVLCEIVRPKENNTLCSNFCKLKTDPTVNSVLQKGPESRSGLALVCVSF